MPLLRKFRYIAFFDLDMTLLSVNSANIFVRESLNRNMMTREQVRYAYWLSLLHKLDWKDTGIIIRRLLGWLEGLRVPEVEMMCEEVFNESLKDFLRPGVLHEIDLHRQQDAAIVLLSSATTFACSPVAKYLNMDDVICSRIEEQNGLLKGHTSGKLVFGPEKKYRLLSYCETEGYNPYEAYYYGDSISDLHVLEAVGNPVCVYPDKKLRRIAVRRGWRIFDQPY
ncbi:MAG TPA: HAD-IB family hydrolase [Bacteroidaceae bacterium]|nr:HAD-IB family hydrolase [Bacteroidaceae bacterium]